MPASKLLNIWVAESGSWQSFVDFHLPVDAMADYNFMARHDDFYLSLMSRAMELLKENENQSNNEELLAVAKGLEVFSLKHKKDYFKGVNQSNNVLYAAGLYYLSNYSASAWILANIYSSNNYIEDIDLFISGFLRRRLDKKNTYERILGHYLQSGNLSSLALLIKRIQIQKEIAFDENVEKYFSFILAEKILLKFQNDNIWSDLLKVNRIRSYWSDFVNQSIVKKIPIWNFFPSQKLAIEKGVLSGDSFALQMPTSSGKTSIFELIIYDEYKKNPRCKILYLAPFRALASELKQSLAVCLGRLGIKSKTIYGGNLPTYEEKSLVQDVNLIVATPEKFMAMEDAIPDVYREFTTIICDEGHLLDDSSRGLSYELLLSRLKEKSEKKRRFIFASAIIPNISVVNKWLGGSNDTLITSDYRPTELEYAFLLRMDSKAPAYYLDVNPYKSRPYNYQLYKFLSGDDLTILNPGTGKKRIITSKKGISVATALKATQSGTVALFAPHKRGPLGVEDLVEEAIQQLINRSNYSLIKYSPENFLEKLSAYFSIVFGNKYLLTISSKLGILFHHADLPQAIREIIEDAIRHVNIRIVICTNTLAEGVNLPIQTIVLHSVRRFNPNVIGNWEPLKIRDLKNLVGRAGRAGKETKGLVIVPDAIDFPFIKKLINETNIEPVRGQLYNIITLITNALKNKRLLLNSEMLDSLNEEFQQLLDSIDISMIDLLAEEVESDKLVELINDLINRTLSFYQSDAEEKKTLNKLFELRTEKLKPIIARGYFKLLKHSGSSIRLFNEIISHFDLENKIWTQNLQPLNDDWLKYILDEGVFKFEKFKYELEYFNEINKCKLDSSDVKKAVVLWMSGNWFNLISEELSIEIHQTLRLINGLISFCIQSIISSVIRVKELKSPELKLPNNFQSFPSLMQHGLKSTLQLDIIDMGLIDRISVLALGNYLESVNYEYSDYFMLKKYFVTNGKIILSKIEKVLPVISFEKTQIFLERLNYRNLY